MKNLLMLVIIVLAAYGGYTIWTNHRDVAPAPTVAAVQKEESPAVLEKEPAPVQERMKEEPEMPLPAPPAKRLAPEGVMYAVQALSVATDEGVRGVRAGSPVTVIKDNGPILRVSDGKDEFDARRESLTNDLDVAAQVAGQEIRQQAANYEWQQKQNAAAAINEQQKAAEEARSISAVQQKMALNALLARRSVLNLEAAKIQATISEYSRAPIRAGTHFYDQYGVRQVVIGDTHVNDLIALRQKLAAINAELSNISIRINHLPR